MRIDKIVARLDKTFFHLKLLSGEVVKVDIEKLKAAFNVKTFNGNKNYNYTYKDVIPWGGNKVKVEFIDGEVIIGYTPHYSAGHQGFFITPADLQGNNKEVYVVTSATKEITYL
jgi:hypothetical protein